MNESRRAARSAGTADPLMETASEQCSVFERIMAKPKSRHAYFNTTRGILTGDPDQDETIATRELLAEKSIAHLFTADRSLPQPMFYVGDNVRIGNKEISALARRLAG